MAYPSKAGTGLGSTLSINGTLVGEIKTMKLAGRQAKTDDVTNFDSLATEFIPTIITSGTWDLTGNRIGSDAGQIAMEAAFNGLLLSPFSIHLAPTQDQGAGAGDTFTFTALVEAIDYDVASEKSQSFTAKLKISGLLTRV
jgi:hypothetical protein